jgi:DNA-binding NtrC family response regulator
VASKKTAAGTGLKPVVMVIEPEVLVRMTIADVLRECGYEVIEGIVAEDVFTVLSAGRTLNVVFSEVQLAGDCDGFALAQRLRRTHPRIDVILTSGVAATAEKSKELCEDGPMKKPYRSQDVVARVNLLLERRRESKRRS